MPTVFSCSARLALLSCTIVCMTTLNILPCIFYYLELQTKNGSRESLRCINRTVIYTLHWEKLTSSLNGTTSCSILNLGDGSGALSDGSASGALNPSDASGGLGGGEEMGEHVIVSNSSLLEFDPAVFGDEGCYRCVVAGVPSDLTYIVTGMQIPVHIICIYAHCKNQ